MKKILIASALSLALSAAVTGTAFAAIIIPQKVAFGSVKTVPAISESAWLNTRLPESSISYMRIPSFWGAFFAPDGRVLDAAFRSSEYKKTIIAFREAFSNGDFFEKYIGHVTEFGSVSDKKALQSLINAMTILLGDMSGPLEFSVLDPNKVPSPASQVFVTVKLNIPSIEMMNQRIATLVEGSPVAPVVFNAEGFAVVPNVGILFFDLNQQRLFGLLGIQKVDVSDLQAFIKKLDTPKVHSMQALEADIDRSGQGLFFWSSVKESMPMLSAMMPKNSVLLNDLVDKIESIAIGTGTTADGHGQLRMRIQIPNANMLSYLAPDKYELDFKSAGMPKGVMTALIPDSLRIAAFEADMANNFGQEVAASYQLSTQLINQFLGISLSDFAKNLGPELVRFEDTNGHFVAVRVADVAHFNQSIDLLLKRFNGKKELLSNEVVHISLHNFVVDALLKNNVDKSNDAFSVIFGKIALAQKLHFYYRVEGNWLIFGSVPQSLMDRANSTLDVHIGNWLKTEQGYDASQSLFGFTGRFTDVHRNLYYAYIQAMQSWSDFLNVPVRMDQFPTANALNLRLDSRIGFSFDATANQLGFTLSYDQTPFEGLYGLDSGAALTAVAGMGILSAIAIPRYQDYVMKMQVVKVAALANSLRVPLEACVAEGKTTIAPVNASNAAIACDVDMIPSSLIAKHDTSLLLGINPQTGMQPVAWINAPFGREAHRSLKGLGIQWVRDNEGTWSCHFGQMALNANGSFVAVTRPRYGLLKLVPKGCTAAQ